MQKMPQLLGLKSVKVGACFVELCFRVIHSNVGIVWGALAVKSVVSLGFGADHWLD